MKVSVTVEPQTYTRAEACRVAGIGRTKFWEMEKAGRIKVRQVGSKGLVLRSDLLTFLEELPTSLDVAKGTERTAA